MNSQIKIQMGMSGQLVSLNTTRNYILARNIQRTERLNGYRGAEEVPKRRSREIKEFRVDTMIFNTSVTMGTSKNVRGR
jgi:hypothetical protein